MCVRLTEAPERPRAYGRSHNSRPFVTDLPGAEQAFSVRPPRISCATLIRLASEDLTRGIGFRNIQATMVVYLRDAFMLG
jgi:hypothetical protein